MDVVQILHVNRRTVVCSLSQSSITEPPCRMQNKQRVNNRAQGVATCITTHLSPIPLPLLLLFLFPPLSLRLRCAPP